MEFQIDSMLFQTKSGWNFFYTDIYTRAVCNGEFYGVFDVFSGSKKETLAWNGFISALVLNKTHKNSRFLLIPVYDLHTTAI